MSRRGLLLTLPWLAACYAEVGAGYYPVIHETVTGATGSSSTKSSGYVGMIKLGFYLDVPLRALHSAVGAGLSPGVGGDGISPGNAPAKVSTEGIDTRLDVALPYFLSFMQPRVTLAYLDVINANITTAGNPGPVKAKATGHTLFLGGSLGASKDGSLILLSAGLQHQSSSSEAATTSDGAVMPVDISASGVAARLMITWTPTGQFMASYKPSTVAPQTFTPCTKHTIRTCDSNGKNCSEETNCY